MTQRLARTRGQFASTIAAAAIIALLAPALLLALDQRLAAWAPGHGHIGNAVTVATHSHDVHDHPNAATTTDSSTTDLVFTASGDASVVTAITLSGPALQLPALAAPTSETESDDLLAPATISTQVPTPPPRV